MEKFSGIIDRYKKLIIGICSIIFVFSFVMLVKMEQGPIYYEMEYTYTVPEVIDRDIQEFSLVFSENGIVNVELYYRNGVKRNAIGLYVVNSYTDVNIIEAIFTGDSSVEKFESYNKKSFISNIFYGEEVTFLCKEVAVAKSLYVTGLVLPILVLSCLYIIYPKILKRMNQEKNIESDEKEIK